MTTRPQSAIALVAEARLRARLPMMGRDTLVKLRFFRTARGRELALDLINDGIYLWAEPASSGPPAAVAVEARTRYGENEPRHSNIRSNAPRLAYGNPAEYWKLATMTDLDGFIDWY